MDRYKKKHIEQLVKESSLDKAPKDFTSKVMQDVSILSNEVELKDSKLTKLLQENLLESVPYNFTSNIIDTIENTEDIYKPIISKSAWVVIISSFIGLVLYILFNSRSSSESPSVFSKISPYFQELSFNTISLEFNMSSILVFSLLVLSSLLFLDYFLKQREMV